ncbi:MAG TPA: hypothetical protein VI299_03230 [Polyangiales bacterium]
MIRERVQALEQLELLLLMHGEPDRGFSMEELTQQLSMTATLVEAALAHLTHHGFLAVGERSYRYAPADPQLARAVDELARSYDDARVEVLALISSDAVGRVRRGMRQLMDRLKK